MEQAVNQFNKGLQSDIHPMVQGNDVLSDALNATFVTMNGNEVVLQNDMGNRRVDNAYLPSGYEPVGMKEYGGVIYIAAYNPITNKSQIGSFPSPERKISSEDGSELGGQLNLDSFEDYYQDKNLKLNCIKNDTILVSITHDTSLHTGDKFVVYGNLESVKQDITNYFNTKSTKVKSPKNKKYTLALGILNSQNEFVDITKTLTRWDGNTIIDYTNKNVSDLYKFNDGYFIASSFNNPTFDETINDAQLIQERQTIATNTYAYKLVGPLYVKATLNHIKEFNYNIYGVNSEEQNTAEIWIEAFITYNCPDGIETISEGDDNYKTYFEDKVEKFVAFDLYDLNLHNPDDIESHETKYDPITNLYSCKIVKHYSNIQAPNDIWEYVIGVRAFNDKELYLSGLSTSGKVNISLFGSGTVKMHSFKFISDYSNRSSTVTYYFDAYPKYGESFQNFRFLIKESFFLDDNKIDQEDINKEIPATINNGRNSFSLDWEKFGLTENRLYRVLWRYDIVKSDGKIETVKSENSKEDRWILTTELFNDCYNPKNPNYINDYGNPKNQEDEIFKNKCKVSYIINSNVVDKTTKSVSHTGDLISKKKEIKIEYTTKQIVKLQLEPTIEFNEKLYPDYIYINPDATNDLEVSISSQDLSDFKMEYYNNTNKQSPTEYDNIKFTSGNNNPPNSIFGTIQNYDYYYSQGNQDGVIQNGFTNFYNYLSIISSNREQKTYSLLMMDADQRTGHRDIHFLKVDINSQEIEKRINQDGEDSNTQIRLDNQKKDGKYTYKVSNYINDICEKFNNTSNDYLFTWGYYNDGGYANIKNNDSLRTGFGFKSGSTDNFARVWWRTSFGDWALFPAAKSKDENIVEFIKKTLTTDFIFAAYESINLKDCNLYIPSEEYIQSKEYSVPFKIEWEIEKSNNGEILSIPDQAAVKETFFCKVPIFEVIDNAISDSYELQISSSDEFINLMDLIPKLNNISGFDLSTGKYTDINGEELNPLNFYKNINGELVQWNNSDMTIDSNYGPTGMRGILYNRNTKGSPNHIYDVGGRNNDSHTVIYYDNVNIVRESK